MQTKTYSQHTKSAVHKGHVHSSLHHVWTVWFQQILWCLCGYACDCLWCECDLIEQNLVMRHVSHRYKLVWTKMLPFMLKCLLSFSEEHVCTKNGVSYENHKVVMWQWPPSLGYTYWFTITQVGMSQIHGTQIQCIQYMLIQLPGSHGHPFTQVCTH